MTSAMLRQTRLQILLSLNAAAILIAGVVIASAIWIPKESTLRVVSERSDELDESEDDVELLDPVSEFLASILPNNNSKPNSSTSQSSDNNQNSVPNSDNQDSTIINNSSSGTVTSGELWSESSLTIYQTADQDICVDGSLTNLGDMYWQTSNPNVISAFYSQARTRLGYNTSQCRYPKIVGTGTTTITAGTYDGTRHDSITVTVLAVPAEQWKHEVLKLINQERASRGLSALAWSSTCEAAAQTRAHEIMTKYDHVRPDGSSWQTACPIPSTGGTAGENLAAGNTAVSPATVVSTWMNSESHRNNILNPNFTKMAVGFVFDSYSQYKTYWSEFFSTY